MKTKSRTKNALLNMISGSTMQIINVLLGFVSRTIFIKLLNADYLGVNSLYSNILMVLSFAELGIGNAIAFCLYEPIANNDKKRIQALMKFYKKAYSFIGIIIFIIGLGLIPFMNIIIKNPPNIKENLTLIYILFLLNTSISYFFSYKKTLIIADQKVYIENFYNRLFQIIQVIAQSILLLLTHQYLAYLIIYLVCTILLNVSLAKKADKLYPLLQEKNDNKLSKEEIHSIFKNVKALFVYKFGAVILDGTDSIIISAIINITTVGISSNYTLLINSVSNIVGQGFNGITASIGNLAAQGDKKKIRTVINELRLLCVWLYGFVAIGFITLSNDFVRIWLGNDFVLPSFVVCAIVFSVYINGVQYPAYVFRITQGLFVQSKWIPLIAALLNVILSIWWGKLIGVAGIFVATGVSRLCTTTLVDPWLVYKNNFSEKPYEYYIRYILESVGVVFNCIIQYIVVSSINMRNISGFVVKFIVVVIGTNFIFFIEFGWTKEFKNLMMRIIHKR